MKSLVKYILLLLIPVSSFVGCSKDEIEHDQINHSVITTSFGTSAPIMQVNDHMSFVDLSRGVVSREWTFPADVTTDMDGYPILTSSSDNQKVIFTEPGEYYVNVTQTFMGDVYVGDQFTGGTTNEQTIYVNVRDSVRASYTAVNLADNSDVNVKDGAKNEVEAGSTIRFTVTSTGEPSANTFTLFNETGTLSTVSASEDATTGDIYADIQLAMTGVWSVKLQSSSDFGVSTIEYTDLFEVIPSTDPIYLSGASRTTTAPGSVVALTFSRGMVKESGFSNDAFTIAATNDTRVLDISVTDVSISGNIVNLTLSDMIYSSDIVSLSYDNTLGTLSAIDNADITLDSFADEGVMFPVVDIMAGVGYDVGFEGSTCNWTYLWWGGQWSNYLSDLSSAQVHSGAQSFKIEMSQEVGITGSPDTSAGSSGAIMANKVETFPVTAETVYLLAMWTYVESLSPNLGTDATDLMLSFNENTVWDRQITFNADTPIGEWVQRTVQLPAGSYTGDATIMLRGNNKEYNTPFIIYLDDLTLSEAETRP